MGIYQFALGDINSSLETLNLANRLDPNDILINKKISNNDLKKMFDLEYHTKNINIIYKRVFGK